MGKILDQVLDQLNKTYGQGTVMRLNDEVKVLPEVISSGSISLDAALGVGGYPKGRIVEIFGPESSGKTTLTLHAIAEAQKKEGICAFIDSEHAFDANYAEKLGVKINDLIISQPDNGEQALEILDKLLGTNELSLIIVDSVAALTPKAEIDGEMGEQKVGLQARLMSQAMRKIVGKLSKSGCLVIFTNQLRDRIGVFFGDPSVTTGGKALKFYATIRIDIRKISAIKSETGGDEEEAKELIGNVVKVKVVKNKVAPPFREAELVIIYGEGVSYIDDIFMLALKHKIIFKDGAKFLYQETILGESESAAIGVFADNPELIEEVERKVKAKLGLIELTEEEKKQFELEEYSRKWNKFADKVKQACDKYKLPLEPFLKEVEPTFKEKIDYYKPLTLYQLSKEIKAVNEKLGVEN